MPAAVRTVSKDAVDCPARVADQEPEVRGAVAEVHHEVADLLGGPRSVRVGGNPKDGHGAGPTSMRNRQYRRRRVTAQSTWKKSAASMVAAWACRNCRHVVSVRRFGAGGIRGTLRTRRIVDALTR
jgi:hypothetical protein